MYSVSYKSLCSKSEGMLNTATTNKKKVQQASKPCTKWRLHSLPPEFYKLEKEECTWKIKNNETVHLSTYFVILWNLIYKSKNIRMLFHSDCFKIFTLFNNFLRFILKFFSRCPLARIRNQEMNKNHFTWTS